METGNTMVLGKNKTVVEPPIMGEWLIDWNKEKVGTKHVIDFWKVIIYFCWYYHI